MRHYARDDKPSYHAVIERSRLYPRKYHVILGRANPIFKSGYCEHYVTDTLGRAVSLAHSLTSGKIRVFRQYRSTKRIGVKS